MRKFYVLTFLFLCFFINLKAQTSTFLYNSSSTFTVPAGVTSITVNTWGGGGGGGGGYNSCAAQGTGSAGGGGGYAQKVLSVTAGQVYTITVGAGGTAGAYAGNGGAGGTSTVTGAAGTITSTGGGGGLGGTACGTVAGGSAGAGTVGTILFSGGAGSNGISASGITGNGGGGAGSGANGITPANTCAGTGTGGTGTYTGGTGGKNANCGTTNDLAGAAGNTPGGGGGGGLGYLSTTGAGGAGGSGQVIITYTTPVCVTPVAPTLLMLTPNPGQITGTFTAPSPAATNYLVIRTTSATPPTSPSDGITYIAGTTALGGYIVSTNASTGFTDYTVAPSTAYYYWVFSYNAIYCSGGPLYATTSLNGTVTSAACTVQTNTMSITAAGTYAWNTAANWSLGHVPYPCENVVITFTKTTTGAGAAVVNLGSAVVINNLTINGVYGAATGNAGVKSLVVDGLTYALTINGNLAMTATGGNTAVVNYAALQSGSSITVNGSTTIGGTSDTKFCFFGSNTSLVTVNINGSLTYNTGGGTFSSLLTNFIFNGSAAQTITHNNTTYYADFGSAVIGNGNPSVITLAGQASIPARINGGSLTVNSAAQLVLPAGKTINQVTTGSGILTINNGGTIKVGGTTGGFTGNNFPTNFASYGLGTTSTVVYNGSALQTAVAGAYGNLTVANTLTGSNALTIGGVTSVANLLTLTSGIIGTTSTNTLTVNNTVPAAVAGGTTTAFINGPLNWVLPASPVLSSVYNFPVGAATTFLPYSITNVTGTSPLLKIQAYSGATGGTPDMTLGALSTTEYWSGTLVSGTFSGGSISVTRQTALGGNNLIGQSATQAGTYTSIGGTVSGNSIVNSNNITTLGYFVMATTPLPCTTPNDPTGLVLIPGTTSVTGTFLPALPVPTGYLVIRTTSAAPPFTPVLGTVYTPGTNALGGYIVSTATTTGFTDNGLTFSTQYWYWVYSYNTGCAGTNPIYSTGINGNTTTLPCAVATNIMAIIASGTYNWNTASNWSLGHVPYYCEDAVITASAAVNGTATVNLSANVNVNSLSVTLNGAGGIFGSDLLVFNTNAFALALAADLNITNTSAGAGTHQLQFNISANGSLTCNNFTSTLNGTPGTGQDNLTVVNTFGQFQVNGATLVKAPSLGTNSGEIQINVGNAPGAITFVGNAVFDDGTTSATSDVYVGTTAATGNTSGSMTFKGNATFGNRAFTLAANIHGSTIFDAPVAQTLSVNSTLSSIYFPRVLIGSANSPTVTLAGSFNPLVSSSSTAPISLSVNNNAVLDLQTHTFNLSSAATSSFNISAGATLKAGGSTGGQTGSNFPLNFSTYALNAASNVEYNSFTAVNQTVYAPVTYGNLTLTNGTGSGTTTKSLTTNITGIAGNLTVNPYATFDLATFTANTAGSGSLTVNANGNLKLGAAAGGQTGSNFPTGFTPTLNSASTVDYSGTGQTIYGIPSYGNLTSSGITGTITAPSGTLTILGNLRKTGANTFVSNNGTVLMNGPAAQGIYSVAPDMDFNYLTDANNTGLTVYNNIAVSKELAITGSAVFNLDAGNVTIRSTASGTADVASLTAGAINYPGAGRFIIERYITTPRKWQFLSPNATTGTLTVQNSWMDGQTPGTHTTPASNGRGMWVTDISATGLGVNGFDSASYTPSIKYWNLTGDDYVGIGNPTMFDIHSKQGFMAFVRGDRYASGTNLGAVNTNTTLSTKGPIHTYDQTLITQPALNNDIVIGNPFPATVDLKQVFGATSIGTTINIMFWDPKLTGSLGYGGFQYLIRPAGSSDFKLWPSSGGGSYPAVGSQAIVNTLESGQAFFLQSSSSGNVDLQFTEPTKTMSAADVNFTPGNPQTLAGYMSVRGANNIITQVDGFSIMFKNTYNAAANYDDARKLSNTNENVSVKVDGVLLAGELRKEPLNNDTIHINMAATRIYNYRWTFDLVNMDAPGRTAFLVDKFMNTTTPLNLSGSNTYDFSVANVTGSWAADRFYILFKQIPQTALVFTSVTAEAQAAAKNNLIKWTTSSEYSVSYYDAERSTDGTIFTSLGIHAPASGNAIGTGSYYQTDAVPSKEDNYYRIKAVDFNGQIHYSAVVKIAAMKTDVIFAVRPNPVQGKVIHLYTSNFPAGNYQVQLTAADGRIVYKAGLTLTGVDNKKDISLNKSIAQGEYSLFMISETGEKRSIRVTVLE